MATLVQLRQALVEQSGYRALVTNAPGGDYSDKSGLFTNATYYINEGVKWLERRWSQSGSYRYWKQSLAAGQYMAYIPSLAFVQRMEVRNSTGVGYVSERNIEYMRSVYRNIATATGGAPRDWASFPPNALPLFAVNLLDNSTFDLGISPWEAVTGAVSWRDGVMRLTTASGTARAKYPFAQPANITGGTLTFTSVAEQDATGEYFLALVSGDETIDFPTAAPPYDIDALIVTLFDAGTYPAYTLAQLQDFARECDAVEIGYFKSGGGTLTADIDAVVLTPTSSQEGNVILGPHSDGLYELTVFGSFLSEDLSGDSDFNWWTATNAPLVVRAARVQLELDGHRNISGMKAFQDAIEEELVRMCSLHQYAYISALKPEEFVPYG